MSTLRAVLTNILIWLPVLVLDRLSRHVAIATTPEPLSSWKDETSLLFSNTWNPSLFGGGFPPELAAWVAPIGIVILVVVIVYVCWCAQTSVKNLWPLIPFLFSVVSNLSDRFIWGMVSDPFVLTLGPDFAIAFNLADIWVLIGAALLGIVLARDIRYSRSLYFSMEAAHG